MSSSDNRPFDIDEMICRYGNREISEEILTCYTEELRSQLRILSTAISSGRHSEAHRIAHSIRGGAQNISSPGLRDAAMRLEEAVKEKRTMPQVRNLYSAVEHEVLLLAEGVTTWIAGRNHEKSTLR